MELKKKTPAGTLIARYKQDEFYPGFYVDLHGGVPVCTVEYEPSKGCVQVVVYSNPDSDEPSHIIQIPAKEEA